MVGAVGLDDQSSLKADEVGNVAPDRNLATELEALEFSVAQEFPERPLGPAGRPAHLFRKREVGWIARHARIIDTPTLLGKASSTPHPTRFAGHLLPQGEKEIDRRHPISQSPETALRGAPSL